MATYRIGINTDNDTFGDSANTEVARILRKLADKLEHGTADGPIFLRNIIVLCDINDNAVGSTRYTEGTWDITPRIDAN